MYISENALIVLQKRYFRKNDAGELLEDWDGMISREIGRAHV